MYTDFHDTLLDITQNQKNAKTKLEKKEITISYYRYLIDHIYIFKIQEEEFIRRVLDKANEYTYSVPEYKDLLEIIELFLSLYKNIDPGKFSRLYTYINTEELQKLKEFRNIEYKENMSLFDFMSNPYNVIVKYKNEFRGYNRSCLLEYFKNNIGFPTGEKISYSEIQYFEDKSLRFFVLLEIEEDTYVLLPYETNTFIQKFKIK
jgi:hypothetical protein